MYIYKYERLISLYDSTDKSMASCDILEQPRSFAIESDLIENKYNAGSIVWAHVKDFPWWPGIVNDCPDTYTYYRLPKNSLIPVRLYSTLYPYSFFVQNNIVIHIYIIHRPDILLHSSTKKNLNVPGFISKRLNHLHHISTVNSLIRYLILFTLIFLILLEITMDFIVDNISWYRLQTTLKKSL